MNKPILLSKARLLLLVVFFLLVGGTSSYSWGSPHQVFLSIGYDNPAPSAPDHGKNPILVPQVWLDGHEVSFQTLHPAYTLLLMDDDDVVFTYNLPSNGSNVFLPEWLSGEYQIILRPNGCNYYFYGYMEL